MDSAISNFLCFALKLSAIHIEEKVKLKTIGDYNIDLLNHKSLKFRYNPSGRLCVQLRIAPLTQVLPHFLHIK